MVSEVPLARLTPLTADERRLLLRLARQSILAALRHEETPMPAPLTPPLREPGAVFVSLHIGENLRGCVGTLLADRPLHAAVAHTARSAAFEDPRFPPLTEEELALVAIEISRLSAPVPARPEDIRPGVHGVCIRDGDRRGVFLPQVAQRYDWDRETLLRELCDKAMLPPDAWQSPHASLEIFEAEVFGDDRL